jgi:DNA-binding transcriptional ArsR family regulator
VDREIVEMAGAFAALGSTERIRILSYLLAQRGPHCGQIASALGMSTSAFSYHLRILEEAGLVERSRSGRLHCLSLTRAVKELLSPGIRKALTQEGERWTKESSTK